MSMVHGTGPVALAVGILMIVAPLSAVRADNVPLVEEGQPVATVVLSADAGPSEQWAAQELVDHIQQMTGATLTLQAEGGPLPEPAVLIGDGAAVASLGVTVDHEALGDEGFLIKTVGQRLVIAGSRQRGTMYGVFTLLDSLGVRWWTPSETFVPTSATVVIPPTDTTQVPQLEYRDMMYRETHGDAGQKWMARNRVNGMIWKDAPAQYGGRYLFGGGSLGHTMKHLLAKHGIAITEEMKAVTAGGGTTSAMLCLTEQATIDAMIQAVVLEYGEVPDAKFVTVGQEDGNTYCQCPDCQAIAAQEGSQSGPVIHFVNAVAAGVEQQVPGAAIATLAYNWSRTPPQHLTPRANVYIILASYECGFSHPLSTPGLWYNESFKQDLDAWNAMTTKLFIWDYATNFLHYLMPHPNLDVLAPNIRYYADHGVVGIMEQGPWDGFAPEFAGLRQWVFARALWYPTADNAALITEFLQGYYGPAAAAVRQYIDVMERYPRDNPTMQVGIYRNMNVPDIAPEIVAEEEEALRAAEAAVAGLGDPLERRVRHAHMPVWYLLAKRGPGSPAWRAAEARVGTLDIAHIAAEMAQLESDYGINRLAEGLVSAAWFDWLGEYAAQASTGGVPKPVDLAGDDLSTTRLLQACQMERGGAWYVRAGGASDGWAVKPPAGKQTLHYLSPTNDYTPGQKYTAFVRLRGRNVDPQATGTVYRCGVKNALTLSLLADQLRDGAWHTFRIGDVTPSGVAYDFWSEVPTSAGGDIDSVEVDCFWIQLYKAPPDEFPVASASADSEVAEDTDGDSKATVTLDGSQSADQGGPTPGIAEWRWFEGAYDLGTGETLDVAFTLGEHTVTLQVTDNDGNVSTDEVTFTVAPPADDETVRFDLSAAWNYDGYISLAENDHARLYDPPGDWGLGNRKVSSVFGEHDSLPYACPVWEGQGAHAVGIPACGLVNTAWGTFTVPTEIDSPDIPDDPLPPPDSPKGILPVVPNWLRVGGPGTSGETVSVALQPGDRGQYESLNFILLGNDHHGGVVRLYANYEGEGKGADSTLLWEAPIIDDTQTGVPRIDRTTHANADFTPALSSSQIWGSSGDVSLVRSNPSTLWTFDGGLALEPDKTLVGFSAQTTSIFARLFILAASAQPVAPAPGPRISAWHIVTDHGPAGAVTTAMFDGYIEPRIEGLKRFSITFDRAIAPASVQTGVVSIVGGQSGDVSHLVSDLSLGEGDTVLTVALSQATPDVDAFRITLSDALTDSEGHPLTGDRDLLVKTLAGDVNWSGEVTAADVLAVRAAVASPVGEGTATLDVSCSGVITGADLLAVHRRLGHILP